MKSDVEVSEVLGLNVPLKTSVNELYNLLRAIKMGKKLDVRVSKDVLKLLEVVSDFFTLDDLSVGLKFFASKFIDIFLNEFRLKEVLEYLFKKRMSINKISLMWAYKKMGYDITVNMSSLLVKLLRVSGLVKRVTFDLQVLNLEDSILDYLFVKGEVKVFDLLRKFGDITNVLTKLVSKGRVIVEFRGRIFKVNRELDSVDDVPESVAKMIDPIFLSEWHDFHGKKHFKIVFPPSAKVRLVYNE